jgi:X-Pro dipeptidyl-peptidase-like protein
MSAISTKLPIVTRRQATPVDARGGTYPGFRPRQELLEAGTVIDGGRPLRTDIRADDDMAVSNGKVGLAGNSWFAVSQWFSAAERPPHLAAIAPWEGMSDYHRNVALRGGIPTGEEFVYFILTNFVRGREIGTT